jgi:hypothetical protein
MQVLPNVRARVMATVKNLVGGILRDKLKDANAKMELLANPMK